VPVLHAQDVEIPDDWPDDEDVPDAEVEVTVTIGSLPSGAEFVGTLAMPVGSAERRRRRVIEGVGRASGCSRRCSLP